MTPEDLAAIEQRANAVTEGLWRADISMAVVRSEGYTAAVAECVAWEDAEFIGAAKQDIPALLAEVRRLTSALEEMYDFSQSYVGAVKRLRGQLKEPRYSTAAVLALLNELPPEPVMSTKQWAGILAAAEDVRTSLEPKP